MQGKLSDYIHVIIYQTLEKCCAVFWRHTWTCSVYCESENNEKEVIVPVELVTFYLWTMSEYRQVFWLDGFSKITRLELFLDMGNHPAVDLKSMETLSCWTILVGCIKISAHPVADLNLRGTSWLLEIMAEWAKISAQATVQPWPPQRGLLPQLHHLGHQGIVLSKSGHNKVGIVYLIFSF